MYVITVTKLEHQCSCALTDIVSISFFWQYGLSFHVDLFNAIFFRPNSGDNVTYHHQCGDRNGILSGYLADIFGKKKIIIWAQLCQTSALAVMALFNSPIFIIPSVTFMMMLLQKYCNSPFKSSSRSDDH